MAKKESCLEYLIRIVADLEKFFKSNYNASGNGLIDLYDSIQNRIPIDCKDKVRYIAHIRNDVVHNYNHELAKKKINNVVKNVNEIYDLCNHPEKHYPTYSQLNSHSQENQTTSDYNSTRETQKLQQPFDYIPPGEIIQNSPFDYSSQKHHKLRDKFEKREPESREETQNSPFDYSSKRFHKSRDKFEIREPIQNHRDHMQEQMINSLIKMIVEGIKNFMGARTNRK